MKNKQHVCKYFSCYVAKQTGRDCSRPYECQTAKFFDKYGPDGYLDKILEKAERKKASELESEELGIGAMMVAPGKV